ncbi:MAG: hypothetical protein DRR19_31070, partial [Candidatus Parabeggiatoa sp. nov. 1]
MSPKNPYITGNPVGDTHAFVGRADIVREVLSVLKHNENNAIVLFGQRRIGKTSVLHELETKLPKEGPYYPIFFDLLDKSNWPLERLLQDLAKKISDVLQQEQPNLGADPKTTFREVWLPELLKGLPSEKILVLLLDEFDVLDDLDNEGKQPASAVFFPYIRDLLNTDHQHLNLVFVIGRKIDDMTKIAKSLFKTAPHKRVSLLAYEDSIELIRLSETNKTLKWTKEAIEKIWELTHGHPYLTQHFCSRVWENLYNKNPNELPTATLKEVETVEKTDILEASRNALEWLWDGLPPAERVVASILAGAGAKTISEKQLEQLLQDNGVRMMLEELQQAPRILQEWDLIEEAEGQYRFRVELLRRWIAESKPIKKVQQELDRVEPVADALYHAGNELYKNGRLKDALEPLRKAISLNPHHVGANVLLANILLALKKANDALEILEKLKTYNPNAARTGLIKTFLTLAHSSKNEDEQLKYYKRVLELDTGHPEAKTKVQKIWGRRGDKAYKKGQLNEALKIYQAANLNEKAKKVQQELNRSAQELKQAKRFERRQRITVIRDMIRTHWKSTLETVGVIALFVGTYFFFESFT